jgi:uncharacterized repeat protein (TIGR01451 family)
VDTHHRAWLGDVELAEVTWVDATKLTATVPAGLPTGSQRLTVENALGAHGTLEKAFTVLAAPAFSATVSVDRTTVNVGQPFTLTLALANDGGADVNALTLGAPSLTPSGLATVSPGGPSPAAPGALAQGVHQSFAFACQGAAPGRLTATFGATTGLDALLGTAVTASPPASVQMTVQRPAKIDATLSIPPSVAVGGDFPVTMTVTNSGETEARAVTPATPSVVGSGGTAVLRPGTSANPASAPIPGGQTVVFTWTFTATTAGSFQLAGGASGTDANLGAVAATPTATSNVALAGNAAIIATIKLAPASVTVGQTFPVVVTFSNPGTAGVISWVVTPSPLAASGPVPALTPTLAASQVVDETWNFTSSAAGNLPVTFTALGLDASTGLAVTGSASATIAVVP